MTKKISRVLKTLRVLIIGWGFIIPLSYLFPRKKNLVLFMGKNNGLFFDNVKYLYLYLHGLKLGDVEYYFFTENKSVYNMLRQHNLPALLYPTLSSILALIRSSVVISCNTPWRKKYKYHLSFRAKKVQLWHGVGLKKIGLMVPANVKRYNSFTGRFSDAIRGKNYIYDLFVSTSDCYTENLFSKAVRARSFIEAGYPRNDILFKKRLDELDLLEADTESLRKIDEFRKNGFKCILYAPTWDDPMGNPIKSGLLNLEKLSLLAKEHKFLFVLKFHPAIRCDKGADLFDNIIYYSSSKDIQPLLKATDVLITDYSSVYMDYLLLDRPIVFFPYNYEKYMESQEGLLFDYGSMSPGPICYSQDQLHEAITSYVLGHTDEYVNKRAEVKKLAFKYKDGKSSERIWNFIMKEYLGFSKGQVT
ncbi:MAG: CDP-glycerol glycerophosphotransferase family protein [Sedimentisphaerales bacterium]